MLEHPDKTKLSEIFKELEFRSLANTILGNDVPVQGTLFGKAAPPQTASSKASVENYSVANNDIKNSKHKYVLVDSDKDIKALVTKLEKSKGFSFDTETTGIDANKAELVGLSFCIKAGEAYYIPVPEERAAVIERLAPFKAVLEDEKMPKVGQNIKYDLLILKWYDIEVQGAFFDTMISHYLLEPDLRHGLDFQAIAMLDYKMMPISDLIGKGKGQLSMRDVPLDKVVDYASEDADITLQIKKKLEKELKKEELTDLYYKVEEPLIRVLCDMEYEGVRIDGDFLNDYSKVLAKEIAAKQKEIHKMAGVNFNIASPKQVGEVLFDKLKIKYRWRKTAGGQYSTDVEKLNELAPDNKIIQEILQYRKFAKLKSTYVDALPHMINKKTGRVHSNFNQARAATGRLSSEGPNLQNIPIKDEAGREIRKAFIPRDKDHILLAADYSQIELRLIADISKDEYMLEAFNKGLDFHKATAAKVYEVPFEEVTPDQRRNAKTVNFSIIYGAGATNLSRQLGIKRGEAKKLIETYFAQFKGLKTYMDETVNFARENGYVKTLAGRKRILRDINSRNGLARSNAERMAINTPIQGSAADMIKLAMIEIHKEMKAKETKSKMIMQVHDELVFDIYKPELEEMTKLIVDKMGAALPELSVPIIVEPGTGQNWLEAH